MTDMKYYIDENGVYLGGWNQNPPAGAIEVKDAPQRADQLWLFPGWSESPSLLVYIENTWREEQMPIAKNNVTALEFGDEEIAGTAGEWKAYWLALYKWTETNPDFPDSSKRPVAPT